MNKKRFESEAVKLMNVVSLVNHLAMPPLKHRIIERALEK